MTTEANKELVRRLFDEVVNRHNPDIVEQLIVADAVDHNPGPSDAPGRQGLKEVFMMLHTAFPDLHGTIDDMIAEDDTVVVRWTISGTNTCKCMGLGPTTRQMTGNGMDILRIVDGKITDRWGNSDDMGMLVQLGIVPSIGGD